MQEYIAMWQNFFNFNDRTTRRGYWMAFLFNVIISLVIGFASGLLGLTFIANIYTYAAMIPGIAIGIRRLRDAGKHWAWVFINFVPLVGFIVYIVFLCQESSPDVDPAIPVV